MAFPRQFYIDIAWSDYAAAVDYAELRRIIEYRSHGKAEADRLYIGRMEVAKERRETVLRLAAMRPDDPPVHNTPQTDSVSTS